MATVTIPVPATLPAGEIVALGVSAEDYMAQYAETFHEWVEGVVIKMSPASRIHSLLTLFFANWWNAYCTFNPIGELLPAPFVMKMESIGRFREPDLQIVLNDNPGELTDIAMIGAADICIEIVSPESVARDYGDKFNEYEQAGVREYWIIDPIRQRATFNRLNEDGVYSQITPDDEGYYHTPLLPKFALHVPMLWEIPPLPDGQAIQDMMKAIVENDDDSAAGG